MIAIKDPPEVIKGTIAAYDGAGTLFRWYESERAVYEDGDADPLFRHIHIQTAAELRHLVEGYRMGYVRGIETGRIRQMFDIRKALGINANYSDKTLREGENDGQL